MPSYLVLCWPCCWWVAGPINCCAVSNSGNVLATGGQDKKVSQHVSLMHGIV